MICYIKWRYILLISLLDLFFTYSYFVFFDFFFLLTHVFCFTGLPGMIPGAADRNLLSQAYRASEDVLVERAMLEDKIRATGNFI
jgi:hypothetical protein